MRRKKVFFSIIIPTLNEEKYLPKLLEDLSNQTFKDFEVIVVDAESEDGTVQNALSFRKRIPALSILKSKKRDVSYQRNLGSKKARGEWLIFMDADDRLPFYFLEGIGYRIKSLDVDIFTCWCEPDSKYAKDKAITTFINLNVEIGKSIGQPTSLGALIGIKRIKLNKTGGFKEGIFAEDGEFIRRAVKKGLRFEVFRDPKYTFSLRRFRKFGNLGTIRKYATLHLKRIAGIPIDLRKEYPMGGKIALEESFGISFLEIIKSNLILLFKKPRKLKKIKSLLELIENGF